MMKHILLMICTLTLATGVYAQNSTEDETYILVCRYSGEVNIFRVSEMNSINLHNVNTNLDHDELVSQVFSTKDATLVVPISDIDSVVFSPTPTYALPNCNIMPITSYETNGVVAYVAGASVVGTVKDDATIYHVGNYLPIPTSLDESDRNNGSAVKNRRFIQGLYISGGYELIGIWTGKYNGEDISLTFKDDDDGLTGTYVVGDESRSFKYSLNKPQSGDVRLLFEDETAIVITIINVNDTTLKYYNKNDKTECTLNRQY